jgi:predicted RNase H-like nuclease (RuvC/YqgF family)
MTPIVQYILQQTTTTSPVNVDLLTKVSAILFILLGGGGIYAMIKVRPEAARISVNAAQGAVKAQGELLDDLREELDRQKEENKRLAERLSELERTSHSVAQLYERVGQLEAERTTLRKRIQHLERENRKLTDKLALIAEENGNGEVK